MTYDFANRTKGMQGSAIREMLKHTTGSKVIAFAAGNPAPECFPVSDVQKIAADLLERDPILALQYGITEGYAPLRRRVLEKDREQYGIGRDFDDVIITSGAQQVVDLATKILVNEGDTVITENPSFIGSLNAFRIYGAKLAGVEMEEDGMSIEGLEKALNENKNVKLIYTIPNFQNPTGATMSLAKRKAVYELAKKHGVLIIEDNPYGEIRASGEFLPSIKSFDEDGIVIYTSSFSKILAPGIRVGYVVAPKELVDKMVIGKQTADVHTPMLVQLIVNEWLENYDYKAHIRKIRGIYRERIDLMCGLLDEKLGDFFSFHKPEGGLFVWCRLPDRVDSAAFVRRALECGVATVPGSTFLTDSSAPSKCLRLNFSTPTLDDIAAGIDILKKVSEEF